MLKKTEAFTIHPVYLFLFSFIYLFIGCHYRIDLWDDGASCFGAMRVLNGDVPYKDFILLTTPGYYYALALVFKCFGPSLIAERLLQCVAWSLALVLTHRISRRVMSEAFSLCAWFMTLVWIGRFFNIPGPVPLAMLFSLLAFSLWIEGMRDRRTSYFLWSGAAAGLCALLRQDIGSHTALGILFGSWVGGGTVLEKKELSLKFLAALAGTVALPAVYFLSQAPWKDLYFDFIWFPVKVYPGYGHLAWPPLFPLTQNSFIFYFCWAVPALGVFLAAALRLKRPGEKMGSAVLSALSFTAALLLVSARLRPDVPHLFPAMIFACMIFYLGMGQLGRKAAKPAIGIAALVLILSCAPSLRLKTALLMDAHKPFYLGISRLRGIDLLPDTASNIRYFSDYEKAVKYVRSRTTPGEKIFVGSTRHDRICYGDPLFYFLSFTKSATKYHELYRGIVVTEAVQKEMVSELERANVRWVVVRSFLDEQCREPNASSETGGSRVLDNYLRTHFAIEKQFHGELILERMRKRAAG